MNEKGPKKWILRIGEITEILISIILVAAIILMALRLVFRMIDTPAVNWNMGFWSIILQNCFNLVIGIEFVRMLLKHSARSVVEIVLFTVARGMVAEHQDGLETLFLVLSLAGVFAIRKYLLLPDDGEDMSELKPVPWKRKKRGAEKQKEDEEE